MTITTKRISGADLRDGFDKKSAEFGINQKKLSTLLNDLSKLLKLWRTGLEVQIYTLDEEFIFGRIKSSRFNSAGLENPYYATYFHTRAKQNSSDPLLIITFEPVDGDDCFMVVETVITHDLYFGKIGLGKSKTNVQRISTDVKRRIEYKKVPPKSLNKCDSNTSTQDSDFLD